MEHRLGKWHIGVGGWEQEEFDGDFYPAAGMTAVEKLAYYATFFNIADVRCTFWDDSINEHDARAWVSAVSAARNFLFNVKLHSSFTHRKAITPRVTRNVRAVLHELAKRDRLGALLIQLPYAFTNTGANRFHLVKLTEIFSGFPIFVEFRHASWDHPVIHSLLAEQSLSAVSVDLPRTKQLMPFKREPVGNTAYIRLHGRNEKGWLLNGMDTRYDYLYNGRELRELTRRINRLCLECERVFVICNNTTGGKAIANALELSHTFRKDMTARLPAQTLRAFPHLGKTLGNADPTPTIELPFREVG